MKTLRFLLASLLPCATAFAADATIVPGATQYDNRGKLIEAHDGGIFKLGNTYYLYGMDRTYKNNLVANPYQNNFYGINMYSSTDLANWTFVNSILTHNSDPRLEGGTGADTVSLSRPVILYNASTLKYVMYFHWDNLMGFAYPDGSRLGVATCDTIGGNYTYIGSYNPLGLDSRDMSAFVDDDGTGYVISCTNNNTKTTIFRLTADYLGVDSIVNNTNMNGEGVALFKRNGVYYVVLSGYTGWGHNNNWYQTATNLAGPWSSPVTLADAGTNTYESQITYVAAVPGTQETTYMYMGDRWAGGRGDIRSRQVWLPLKFTGTAMHMDWYASWNIDTVTGTWSPVPAGVTVTPISGLVTTEAGGTATFTVRLNAQPSSNVTIGLTSSDTGEGTVSPASLVFTSSIQNVLDVAQTVTVTGVDDPDTDGNVVYTIVTAAATAAGDSRYNGMTVADVTVTNMDNDTAGITVTPTSGLVTTESGGQATFTVVLNDSPASDVTIGISSGTPAEGTVSPASLTFTSANWSTAQTVIVTGADDALIDGNVVYTIVTAAATSGDSRYNGRNADDVSVTNLDNDTAGITVSQTSGLATTEQGDADTFTVVLNAPPSADVTIGLSSSDTTEGNVSPASLTFTTSNWDAAQTVTVTGADDAETDGNIAYTIVTAAAVSTDFRYSGLNAADVAVTNRDDDVASIAGGAVTIAPGGTSTYTLALNQAPTQDVTITVTPDAEVTVDPPTLTFTAANWNVPQTVTVTGAGGTVQGTHTVLITHTAASADPYYNGAFIPAVTVTILNNDSSPAGFGKKCTAATGCPPLPAWPLFFLAGLLGIAIGRKRP